MKRAGLFLLFAFLFMPYNARAQVQTGTFPLGSFSGAPDVVDLANLNSQLTIPVFSKAGRGIPFTFSVTQDSSVWYPVTVSGSTSWQPVGNWGWNQSVVKVGYMTVNVSVSAHLINCGDYYAELTTTTYSGWAYLDGFHFQHPFSITTTSQYNSCTDQTTNTSGQGSATDSSNYYLYVTGGTATQLLGPDGSNINPYFSSGAGSLQDRNGNLISLSSGVITDTLGQTALTIAGSGTPASPYTFTYQPPAGGSVHYAEVFTSKTVQTNFGCSGISEFGPTAENLVTEIDLPDISTVPTDKYTFTYEATPGHSGNVTGRIASITLPTGGTISYSYSGGSSGHITCADGSAATLTRTTPDGTWTYAHTESGSAWTTTVTDPQGNKTVMHFQGIYQTERQVYSGSSTLLETVFTCYNGASPNCNSTGITTPISSTATYVQWPSGLESETVVDYTGFLLPTEEDDYDYGSGSPGGLLRKTLISYASLGNNIFTQPSSITVKNGSDTIVAQTNISYDGGTLVTTSGTPQHNSISGARGNATTVKYLVQGSTFLTRTYTYFDTGNVDIATDVNGGQTTNNYANSTSTCGNAFPTSVTEAVAGLSQSMAWNCVGAVMTSLTDENSKTTTYTYNDADYWRINDVTDPLSNVTSYYYQPNYRYYPYPAIGWSLLFNGGNSEAGDIHYMDGLGRTFDDQRSQSPGSSTLDTVTYTYDANGRPYSVSVPCAVTYEASCTTPKTTQTYDTLNRPLLTTDGGGGTISLTYTANDVLQTIGPAPSGENTKRKQSEYNGLGELTSVCEVTSLTGSGTCAQNSSTTGYWTKYTFDGLGDLTGVTQDAQSGTAQTRTYTFDGLGRMTEEINPETGTKYYYYDSASSCSGTYDGDLVERKDAAGNITCYTYDKLHRVTSMTYPSGPNSGNSPSKYFVYDTATVNGTGMSNAKARLAEAYTCVSPCSTKITDEGFSYTARGEVQDVYESTPHSGGYFHVNEKYWANGALNIITGFSNLPTLTYSADGEGRPSSVSAGSGQNPVSSTSYNPGSEVTQVNLGSGDSDAFAFDPNTFRLTQYKFNVGSSSVVGNLTWNANGTLKTLGITDPFNSTNTQTCSYGYDDVARIASGNCGSVWSQTFTYDAFGNITKTGSSQFQPGYNWQTNRMSSGATYDSNGDVLTDSLHSYAWDVETRPTTIDTVTATYDALGRMVEQNRSGSYTEIVYDPLGNKLALMNGTSTLVKAFAPLPAGATAVYTASGLAYYRHPDWLGSSRFASTTSQTMYNDLAYAPFGETYAQSGSTGVTDISFAGNNEDTVANLYDAYYREYGTQGRWPSPDPAGTAAANPASPQSWNRYAFVLNNPEILLDRTGLDWQKACVSAGGPLGTATNCEWVEYPDPSDAFDLLFGGLGLGPNGNGGGGIGGGGDELTPPPAPQPLTNPSKPQTPCTLSTGQRISQGIQGALNAGIGAYKAFEGAVLAAGGLGLAPETAGVSLVDTAGGAYLLSAGGGQTATGIFQLGRAFTGNGGPETTGEQYAAIASGPLSGVALLASGHSLSDAERAANFESIFTAGNGLINSPGVSSLIDAGLTALGISSTGGCHQ